MKPLHVLLTCHDAMTRLADCVESIENQEHVDLVLHVFDDASEDGSARAADAWLESSRFPAELIRQPEARGIPHAIVSLIEKIEDAQATIALLDARDRLTNPHALHRMQLELEDTSCDLAFSNFFFRLPPIAGAKTQIGIGAPLNAGVPTIDCGSLMVFRRELFDRVPVANLLDSEGCWLRSASRLPITLPLVEVADAASYVPEFFVEFDNSILERIGETQVLEFLLARNFVQDTPEVVIRELPADGAVVTHYRPAAPRPHVRITLGHDGDEGPPAHETPDAHESAAASGLDALAALRPDKLTEAQDEAKSCTRSLKEIVGLKKRRSAKRDEAPREDEPASDDGSARKTGARETGAGKEGTSGAARRPEAFDVPKRAVKGPEAAKPGEPEGEAVDPVDDDDELAAILGDASGALARLRASLGEEDGSELDISDLAKGGIDPAELAALADEHGVGDDDQDGDEGEDSGDESKARSGLDAFFADEFDDEDEADDPDAAEAADDDEGEGRSGLDAFLSDDFDDDDYFEGNDDEQAPSDEEDDAPRGLDAWLSDDEEDDGDDTSGFDREFGGAPSSSPSASYAALGSTAESKPIERAAKIAEEIAERLVDLQAEHGGFDGSDCYAREFAAALWHHVDADRYAAQIELAKKASRKRFKDLANQPRTAQHWEFALYAQTARGDYDDPGLRVDNRRVTNWQLMLGVVDGRFGKSLRDDIVPLVRRSMREDGAVFDHDPALVDDPNCSPANHALATLLLGELCVRFPESAELPEARDRAHRHLVDVCDSVWSRGLDECTSIGHAAAFRSLARVRDEQRMARILDQLESRRWDSGLYPWDLGDVDDHDSTQVQIAQRYFDSLPFLGLHLCIDPAETRP